MLFTLCAPCFASDSKASVENLAKTTIEYDFQYVFLNKYKLSNYGYNEKGNVQCITFTEQGYQYAHDLNNYDNFGLYVYIYNPTQMDIILSEYNQVQLASNLFQPGYEKTPSYCKYPLELVDSYGSTKESDLATNGLILKFKMTNFVPQILTVDVDERAYHVSSIELDCSTNANRNVISVDTGRAVIDSSNESFDVLTIKGNSIVSDDASMDDAGDGGLNINFGGKNLWPHGDIVVDQTNYKTKNGLNLERGTYILSADVMSDDKDASSCLILDPLNNAFSKNIKRGERAFIKFTIDKKVTAITFYASNNFINSNGDTATFSNIQIEKLESPTSYEPYVEPTTISIPAQYNSYRLDFSAGDFLRADKLAGNVRYYDSSENGYCDFTDKDWAQSLLNMQYIKGQTTVVEASSQTGIPVSMTFENIDESQYKIIDYLIDYEFFFQEKGGFVASRLERPDRVLELDTSNAHTYYRIQSDVPGVYNDIRSVWFNVPNEIIKQYGELCALKALWERCQLAPVLVTKDEETFNNFYEIAMNNSIPDENSDCFMYYRDYIDLVKKHVHGFFGATEFDFVFSADIFTDKLPAVFWCPDGWESEAVAVSSDEIMSILDFKGWTDDLFVEIDKSNFDSSNPNIYYASAINSVGKFRISSLWEKFYSFGTIQTVYENDKSFTNIEKVQLSDFELDDSLFSAKYYVSKSDVADIKKSLNGNYTTYLFRYDVTEYKVYDEVYYFDNEFSVSNAIKGLNNDDFVAELTAIRNFDIIEVHFGDVDNYVVFAVSHSPVNAITDITAPYVPPYLEDELWQKIYRILMVILTLVITVAIVYVVSKIWPFIKWMFPKRKKKKKKE